MQRIEFLLERYRHLTLPDDAVRSEFVHAVARVLGVVIEKGDVSLRNGTLYVKGSPALKSELFMKRRLLLDEMRGVLEKKAPEDIR